MRAYGKMRDGGTRGELGELTIAANAQMLRELARWAATFADEMEKPGHGVSHVHFREEMERLGLKMGRTTPDVILSNPRFH